MKALLFIFIWVALTASTLHGGVQPGSTPQVTYVDEIRCEQLKPKTGFFGKIGRLLGGSTESDRI